MLERLSYLGGKGDRSRGRPFDIARPVLAGEPCGAPGVIPHLWLTPSTPRAPEVTLSSNPLALSDRLLYHLGVPNSLTLRLYFVEICGQFIYRKLRKLTTSIPRALETLPFEAQPCGG